MVGYEKHSCGSCTLCCKLMAVYHDEGLTRLQKPANTWCEHCDIGKGCRIYENRPKPCVVFECLWLQHSEMPDELKPDRSHVVMFELPDEVKRADALAFRDDKSGIEVPVADVVIMEDPSYFTLGESFKKNSRLRNVVETLRSKDLRVVVVNKFQGKLYEIC